MRGRARHAGALRRCGRFERATPDFQAKLGYEVDKPGQADMTIASNAVRRRPARAALPHAPLQRHFVRGSVWTCGCAGFVCQLMCARLKRQPCRHKTCAVRHLLSVYCAMACSSACKGLHEMGLMQLKLQDAGGVMLHMGLPRGNVRESVRENEQLSK